MIKRENQKFYINIIILCGVCVRERTVEYVRARPYIQVWSFISHWNRMQNYVYLFLCAQLRFVVVIVIIYRPLSLSLFVGVCAFFGRKRISFHTRYFISFWFCACFFICFVHVSAVQFDSCSNTKAMRFFSFVHFAIKDSVRGVWWAFDLNP